MPKSLTVGQNYDPTLDLLIADFYHLRLIHDVRAALIPANLRPRFDFYNVDLGIVFDTIRDSAEHISHGNGCYLGESTSLAAVKPFILERL
jgi:hypothetical protein